MVHIKGKGSKDMIWSEIFSVPRSFVAQVMVERLQTKRVSQAKVAEALTKPSKIGAIIKTGFEFKESLKSHQIQYALNNGS